MFIKLITKTLTASLTTSAGTSGASGIISLIKSKDSPLSVFVDMGSSSSLKPSPLL